MSEGTISITTDPPALTVDIRDEHLRLVRQGVSPFEQNLPPGMYAVSTLIFGYGRVWRPVEITAGSKQTLRLEADRERRAAGFDGLLLFAKQYLKWKPALPPIPTMGRYEAPLDSVLFGVRFLQMIPSGQTLPIRPAQVKVSYPSGGRAWIDIENHEKSVIFAQLATVGSIPLNIALPPAGIIRPSLCRVIATCTSSALEGGVQLATEWANSAANYLTAGLIDDAKHVIQSSEKAAVIERPPTTASGKVLSRMRSLWIRFEDPAAAVLPRYIELRSGAPPRPDLARDLADIVDWLPDAQIIAAEFKAREGLHHDALALILQISERRLPLFSEGFSTLLSRLIAYSRTRNRLPGLTAEDAKKAHRRYDALLNWAPFVSLDSITLAFRGLDLARPGASQTEIDALSSRDGWVAYSPEEGRASARAQSAAAATQS